MNTQPTIYEILKEIAPQAYLSLFTSRPYVSGLTNSEAYLLFSKGIIEDTEPTNGKYYLKQVN